MPGKKKITTVPTTKGEVLQSQVLLDFQKNLWDI